MLLLAGAAFCQAIEDEDEIKFPAIAGEVYGQAAPGIKSVTINDEPVKVGADGFFKAVVNLHAGEKYLVVRMSYDRLQLVKKYLIVRKTPVGRFRVYVAKETPEKAPSASKAATKAVDQKALAEKKWMDNLASPNFFMNEFNDAISLEALNRAIFNDYYKIPIKKYISDLQWLNDYLMIPGLYEQIVQREKELTLSDRLRNLIKETNPYRTQSFASLTPFQQKKIMFLNRLLLEAVYAEAPVRKNWLISAKEKPAATPVKECEYLYVWEFKDGKLLLVKESEGQYSAEIYIPVSEEWLSLKGLSAKELGELINKPVRTIKTEKKTNKKPAKKKKNGK